MNSPLAFVIYHACIIIQCIVLTDILQMGIVGTMGVHLVLMGTKEAPERWAEMQAANSAAAAEFSSTQEFGALYALYKGHVKRYKAGK